MTGNDYTKRSYPARAARQRTARSRSRAALAARRVLRRVCATDGKRGRARPRSSKRGARATFVHTELFRETTSTERGAIGGSGVDETFASVRERCARVRALAASGTDGTSTRSLMAHASESSTSERRRHRTKRSAPSRCACRVLERARARATLAQRRKTMLAVSHAQRRKIRRSDLFDRGGAGGDARCCRLSLESFAPDGASSKLPSQRALRSCVHVRWPRAPVMLRAQHAVVRRVSSARAIGAELA
jgi:hypothetical protein